MATVSSRDYRSKKDFAAALEKAAGFDRFAVIDAQGAEKDVKGGWSTDRMARGESTTLAMYMEIASRMAEADFRKFVGLSGRFVVTAERKAESDAGRDGKPSYYTEWQTRDGEAYYIFRSLGNAAKYEQLWDWANGMGAELRLSYLTGDETPERAAESAERADEDTGEETGDEEIDWEIAEGTDEDLRFSPVTARNCSVVTKDGKLCLYDNDAEKFITIPWDDAEGGVGEMLEFEPIRVPNPFEGFSDGDDAGDGDGGAEPEDKPLGYRYRLEKDGPWGFISRCFSQSLSPRFSEFRTGEAVDFGCPLWSWSLSEETNDTGERLLELWYAVERETQHEEQSDVVMNSALALVKSWFGEANAHLSEEDKQYDFRSEVLPCETNVPGEKPFFLVIEDGFVWEGNRGSDVVYAPDREGICFSMSYMRRGEERNFYSRSLDARDHIIQYGFDRVMPFSGWGAFWSRDAFSCFDAAWLAGRPWHERGALKYLSGDYYAVRRDGYWALMEERPLFGGRPAPILTPYAFTGIEPLKDQDGKTRDCFLVERFGKRGVLKVRNLFLERAAEYPVPCEYESIQLKVDEDDLFDSAWKGRFLVSRMGFMGEINSDGGWHVHLHREEDAQEEKKDEDDEWLDVPFIIPSEDEVEDE